MHMQEDDTNTIIIVIRTKYPLAKAHNIITIMQKVHYIMLHDPYHSVTKSLHCTIVTNSLTKQDTENVDLGRQNTLSSCFACIGSLYSYVCDPTAVSGPCNILLELYIYYILYIIIYHYDSPSRLDLYTGNSIAIAN